MAIVSLHKIERSFVRGSTAVTVIQDVSVTIERSELVAIMGPSGSGKSTLMGIIGLLDRPTSGEVVLDGQDVGGLSDDKMARLRGQAIGFVFQAYNLLARCTAAENVELPLIYTDVRRSERRARALEALRSVGLEHKAHRRPSQLSGGEQQRVAIARALVRDPPLLLADEPTGALDSETGRQILRLFHALHQAGHTIVIVTHDPQIAAECDRTVRLKDGRLI